MRTIDCDFLVIGSGLSGLMAARHLQKYGHVIVVTKKDIEDSNSDRAQGGIACAISPSDSLEEHVQDTLATGCGLSREEAVRSILSDGKARIAELEELGVQFAQRDVGDYDLGQEGGHSRRRVLHSGDVTGHEVMKVLIQRIRAENRVQIWPNLVSIDLVTTGWMGRAGENRCLGGYFIDRNSGEILAIRAPHTILATGGCGKVYLYTSNSDVATGCGIAMAWRAGLPIKNMEFIQFHPTCLYHPEAKSFLISEAVRGEGAKLINAAGESFMKKYDPRGELAPRDTVARAIDNEMKRRGDPCVYLDITHRGATFLKDRFPNIYQTCLQYGFDMASQPIPVVPAAHYCCGGVAAAVDGTTAMPGLYAVGEVACTGLHGANRLASNSLLEALVCGHKVAERVRSLEVDGLVKKLPFPDWQLGDAAPSDEAVVVEHNWNEVRTCMWDYVGIVRTNKRLERAYRRIETLRREIRQYYLAYLVTPDVLELRNIAAVARLIIRSAWGRKESRGLHYTLDYPQTDQIAHESRIVDPPGDTIT